MTFEGLSVQILVNRRDDTDLKNYMSEQCSLLIVIR